MSFIWIIIILTILLLVFWLIIFIFKQNYLNLICSKCNSNISSVDNFYYQNTRGNTRCALHPAKNYSKYWIKDYVHYRKMLKFLTPEQKNDLKTNNKLEFILEDHSLFKIKSTFYYDQKKLEKKIIFDKAKVEMKSNKSGIYMITRKTDGKKYIGQSRLIDKRWFFHKESIKTESKFSDGSLYKIKDFEFKIILNCDIKSLDFLEAYFIAYYKSFEEGLNRNRGNYYNLSLEQLKILNKMNSVNFDNYLNYEDLNSKKVTLY